MPRIASASIADITMLGDVNILLLILQRLERNIILIRSYDDDFNRDIKGPLACAGVAGAVLSSIALGHQHPLGEDNNRILRFRRMPILGIDGCAAHLEPV